MTEKQFIERSATIDHFTFQSQKRSVVADYEEEGDTNIFSESATENDHFLPNQPMPPPVFSEILSSLINISRADTSLPSETFPDPKKKDLLESPNILQGDHITDQLKSSCKSQTKSGVIKHVDYKYSKRPDQAMSIIQLHNIFHAKQIPQSYANMV